MTDRRGPADRIAIGRRYPRAAAAWETAARVLGGLWLVLAVLALTGFLLGGPPPADAAPEVDFDEDPAAVIGAASEQLDYRDYTVEEWVRREDFETGGVGGGRFYRLHVESSRGQVRGQVQPALAGGTGGFVGDRPPAELFAADGAAWVRLSDRPYWQRSEPARELERDLRGRLNVSAEDLQGTATSVVTDNGSTYAVDVETGPNDGIDWAGTVRYVVAKGEDPHLERVRYVQERRKERTTRVVRVLDYGDAIAVRPADVPSTTVAEIQTRVVRGLDRLTPG